MANTYVKIGSTITVGAGGAANVTFSSIPQTYTDFKIVASARTASTSSSPWDSSTITINGVTSNMSDVYAFGEGSQGNGNADATVANFGFAATSNTATTSNFSNAEIYFSNYTASANKSFVNTGVVEKNTTGAFSAGMIIVAGLWQSTAAITEIKFAPGSGTNFLQYSKFDLYGIKNS